MLPSFTMKRFPQQVLFMMKMTQRPYLAQTVARLEIISRVFTTLTVEPLSALVDEPVSIRVSGLQRRQKITLSALLMGEGKEFVSCAHYTADQAGDVDTTVQSSEGGSFCGVEPMGLFWAMVPSAKHRKATRLLKKDVTVPYDITISAHLNHVHLQSIQSTSNSSGVMATTQVKRWYLGEGVRRVPLRDERLRGTMFIPSGVGPFPAVLDIFGGAGGLFEHRAALMASRGFLTLALAYLQYNGLPRFYEELDYDYFQEAAELLSQHPQASPGGIGVMGTCFGGAVANMLVSFCPKVTAATTINGLPFSTLRDQDINGERIKGYMAIMKKDDKYFTPTFNFTMDNVPILPIWRQDVQVLSITGEDDRTVSPTLYRELFKKIPRDKMHNIQGVYYPGAGHIIEPPYAPMCKEHYLDETMETLFLFGGEMKATAEAQEDSWKRILEHFNKNLPRRSTDGKNADS
ncbi:bile acid-CoA:amino acid N-acyltransferase-like [Haliotis rufescens]|uniref:bile acid-CoA:amino acid N-acyltransferase-like n=1 Tax=Haliotis rufescens TaxID=6454 RepID=UPI00201EA9D9|nr:bile acid-CoA:amino acid N-acyltransferase-like [Haliotis rufescens]